MNQSMFHCSKAIILPWKYVGCPFWARCEASEVKTEHEFVDPSLSIRPVRMTCESNLLEATRRG